MISYYSSGAVREADRLAAEQLGIPGDVLMENAGRGAAEAIITRYPKVRNVLILCGHGNNGGDGFVVARHLRLAGITSVVLATRGVEEYRNEAAFAANAAKNSGINIVPSDKLKDDEIILLVNNADVLVDALLGTGSDGVPRGEAARLIKFSSSHSHIVALDIPSGVDADTGEAADIAPKAELTVTFLVSKPGLVVAPGSYYSGEAIVTGIGVAPGDVLKTPPVLTGWAASDISGMFPKITPAIHKGLRGSLLIIAGSSQYRGAPVLAALSALRAGCGFVTLALPESLVAGAASIVPEAIFVPLPERDGHISFEGFGETLLPHFEKSDAAVLGPGLGRSADAGRASRFIYEEFHKPINIDADALRFTYGTKRDCIVATPHAGEAAHILAESSAEVNSKRLDACTRLTAKFGTVILKGYHTLVSDGHETRVILEGGPELAVPGSGDVLSGLIGAFLASGMLPLDAATLAALIHGASGSLMSGGKPNGLLAREIAEGVRCII